MSHVRKEAKIRDLSSRSSTSVPRRSVSIPKRTSTLSKDTSAGGRQACDRAKDTCHGCGKTGPISANVPKTKVRNKATILVPGSKTLEGAPSSVCAVAGRGSS